MLLRALHAPMPSSVLLRNLSVAHRINEMHCTRSTGESHHRSRGARICVLKIRHSKPMISRGVCGTSTTSWSAKEGVKREILRTGALYYEATTTSGCTRNPSLTDAKRMKWSQRFWEIWILPRSTKISTCIFQIRERFRKAANWYRNRCNWESTKKERNPPLQQYLVSHALVPHEKYQQEPRQQDLQLPQASLPLLLLKEHNRQPRQHQHSQHRVLSAFHLRFAWDTEELDVHKKSPHAKREWTDTPQLHAGRPPASRRPRRNVTECQSMMANRNSNSSCVGKPLFIRYNCTWYGILSSATKKKEITNSYAVTCCRIVTCIAGGQSDSCRGPLSPRRPSIANLSSSLALPKWTSNVHNLHPVTDLASPQVCRTFNAVKTAQPRQSLYAKSLTLKNFCGIGCMLLLQAVEHLQQEKARTRGVAATVGSRGITQLNARGRQGMVPYTHRDHRKKHENQLMLPLQQDGGQRDRHGCVTSQSSLVNCTNQNEADKGGCSEQDTKFGTKDRQRHPNVPHLQERQPEEMPLTTLEVEIADRVGSLCDLLTTFKKFNLNITEIKSMPKPLDMSKMIFSICFQGRWEDPRVNQLLEQLHIFCSQVKRGYAVTVPWFPRCVADLDKVACQTLDAGADLQADHPGFHDAEYRRRRQEIASLAESHRTGAAPERVEYTHDEKKTWERVWTTLTSLYPTCACEEFNEVLRDLQTAGLYRADDLPQMAHINEYIRSRTGFTFRPVAGLLAARDFLSALAFRVFFSTQYIRHPSVPLYTPEPDVIHELLGHAPLLANPGFAEFSQLVGLASLGASEEEIQKLQRCYWFSVEFGLLLQQASNALKAYGAGLLSSPGELRHATSPTNTRIQVLRWCPEAAATQTFPVTTFQPVLFAAQSLDDVREQLVRFCQTNLNRPFAVRIDREARCIQLSTEVSSKPISLQF